MTTGPPSRCLPNAEANARATCGVRLPPTTPRTPETLTMRSLSAAMRAVLRRAKGLLASYAGTRSEPASVFVKAMLQWSRLSYDLSPGEAFAVSTAQSFVWDPQTDPTVNTAAWTYLADLAGPP